MTAFEILIKNQKRESSVPPHVRKIKKNLKSSSWKQDRSGTGRLCFFSSLSLTEEAEKKENLPKKRMGTASKATWPTDRVTIDFQLESAVDTIERRLLDMSLCMWVKGREGKRGEERGGEGRGGERRGKERGSKEVRREKKEKKEDEKNVWGCWFRVQKNVCEWCKKRKRCFCACRHNKPGTQSKSISIAGKVTRIWSSKSKTRTKDQSKTSAKLLFFL